MKATRIAVLIVALLAVAMVPLAADDADATAVINNGGDDLRWEFDNMDGGYIAFSVNNLDGSFTMDVTVYENYNSSTGTGNVVGSLEGIRVAAGTVTEVTVDMPGFTSVGTHTLTVVCTPEGQFGTNQNLFTVTVEVTKNLLSNWVTYAVIIIVVIVIAIFAYLKIRDSPKKKVEMTFEELEAQRKAEMAERAEKKQRKEKPAPSSTERKRYIGSKTDDQPKSKEKKGKSEAPKQTFEELEAEKQAKKAAEKEKKKSTGLTERERYLEEKRKKDQQ